MATSYYTTTAVARILGFSVRQLDYWMQQGMVVPSVQQSHGPGTRRLYGFEDLMQLRFIRRLMLHGWSTQKIRKAIAKLRTVMNDSNPLKSAVLVHDKKTILAICKTKEGERVLLDALDPGGQQVMWVVLDALKLETQDLVRDQHKYEGADLMASLTEDQNNSL